MDRKNTFLKYNAFVSHPVHVMRPNFTAKLRRYLRDYGDALHGFSQAGSAKTEAENAKNGADKVVCCTSLPHCKQYRLKTNFGYIFDMQPKEVHH